jgi:hypothetical protein
MGLPKEHVDWIRATVADHQRRLAQLREGVRLAEEEITFQEMVLDLARNDRLLEALEELHDDPSRTSKLARDPLGYCRDENIPLPEGVELRALSPVDKEGESARLAAHVRHGPWAVEIVWDREAGFSVSPTTGPAESLSPRFMSSIDLPSVEKQESF